MGIKEDSEISLVDKNNWINGICSINQQYIAMYYNIFLVIAPSTAKAIIYWRKNKILVNMQFIIP